MDTYLAELVECTAELKHHLVSFVQEPRFGRWLGSALKNAADPDGFLDEEAAVRAVDDLIFTHRTPEGSTLIDSFIRHRRDLTPEQRNMLLAWREPVEGFFELQRKDKESVLLHNLIDDLPYRTYSNMGMAPFASFKRGDFMQGRLVPAGDVWVVSGILAGFARSGGKEIAKIAMEVALDCPRLAFRNKDLLKRSWEMMRKKRAEFIAAFGADEVILPPGQIGERMRSLGYRDGAALELPAEAFDCETIGLVYDEEDGLGVFLDYGKLRDLFADPSLAADRKRAGQLLGYLRSDSIKPRVFYRLAEAYPAHVDGVYQKVLKQRHFSWAAHGDAMLRKYKPWYYEEDRYPGVLALGERLTGLLTA